MVVNNVSICVSGQPLITSQPGGAGQWMAAPAAMPGVPAGLEYLSQVDQVLVHQQIELLERECPSRLLHKPSVTILHQDWRRLCDRCVLSLVLSVCLSVSRITL